jgi:hypothetical protein
MKIKQLLRALRRRRPVTVDEGTPRRDLPPAGGLADSNTTLRGR